MGCWYHFNVASLCRGSPARRHLGTEDGIHRRLIKGEGQQHLQATCRGHTNAPASLLASHMAELRCSRR